MILCHVFSMNGASTFSCLWEVLGKVDDGKAIKKKIKGVIFDRFGVPVSLSSDCNFSVNSSPEVNFNKVGKAGGLFLYFNQILNSLKLPKNNFK